MPTKKDFYTDGEIGAALSSSKDYLFAIGGTSKQNFHCVMFPKERGVTEEKIRSALTPFMGITMQNIKYGTIKGGGTPSISITGGMGSFFHTLTEIKSFIGFSANPEIIDLTPPTTTGSSSTESSATVSRTSSDIVGWTDPDGNSIDRSYSIGEEDEFTDGDGVTWFVTAKKGDKLVLSRV